MYVYLTIPLNNSKVLSAKSLLNASATGVMLDLEDGVAENKKDLARSLLVDASLVYLEKFSHVIVRPNPDKKLFEKELSLLIDAGLQDKVSIIISKPEMSELTYSQLMLLRDNFKTNKGHVLAIETAASLFHIGQIFSEFKDVIKTAFFGTEDFSLDMGIENTVSNIKSYAELFLLACKAHSVIACGQPGRFLDFGNKDEYKKLCDTAADMGFDGGIAVNSAAITQIIESYSLPAHKNELFIKVLKEADGSVNSMFTLDGKVYGPPEVKKIKKLLNRSKLEFM